MKYSTMSTRGQITIPAEIRKKLKMNPGTRLVLFVEGDKISIEPMGRNYFQKYAGILPTKGKALKLLMKDRKREREL